MRSSCHLYCILSFFFNDTATTEIYTLSLHDALPISLRRRRSRWKTRTPGAAEPSRWCRCATFSLVPSLDRKSTRLNSSHSQISYAVFCLKKKKNILPHVHSFHPYCLAPLEDITRSDS